MQKNFVMFENVYKRYKMGEVTITAADGVSFSIDEGEFAVVVGLSGAGKTTVLNILGGIDNCDEGRIVVGGKDISRLTGKELASYRRYDIGFVFQFYNLIPNLTAKENVELATQICRDSIDAATALESVGLSERMNNFPSQLPVVNSREFLLPVLLLKSQSFFFATNQQVHLITIQEKQYSNFFRINAVQTE